LLAYLHLLQLCLANLILFRLKVTELIIFSSLG
jgi:hypothetical protein